MSSNSFPDLMTMLIGIGKSIPAIIMLMQLAAILVGVYFTFGGLVQLWGASNANMSKFMSSQSSYSTAGGLVEILIGAFLLSLGTLEFVGVLSRSFTGDYAATRMTADILSYTPGENPNMAEKGKAVTLALLALMQAVGFVAIFKGVMSLNSYFQEKYTKGSFGTSMTWILGGMLAWNFKWFSSVINNTIGFDFIAIFSSLK
jgi:hypothetical protein